MLMRGFIFTSLSTRRRKEEVKAIVSRLKELKSNGQSVEAIDVNIDFFRYANNIFRFIIWFLVHIPKIRKRHQDLLEIVDLPVSRWQEMGYRGLDKIEDSRFGEIMTSDFLEELFRVVVKTATIKGSNKPLTMVDFGCGGGHLCRKILARYKKEPVLCIGIDSTLANIEMLRKRFVCRDGSDDVIFREIDQINDRTIDSLALEAEKMDRSTFAIYRGDFFELEKYVSYGKIDIIFHSRVLHHLCLDERKRLEKMCRKLSFVTIELEDIYSRIMPLLAALMTSGIDRDNLPLMNGAVLSCIRDPGKEDLHGYVKKVLPGSYVKLIPGEKGIYVERRLEEIRTLTESFTWYE